MSEKINWKGVSRERKAKIARAINTFGDGAHPMASATNLDYYDATYLLNCILSGVDYDAEWIKKRIFTS